MERHNRMLTWDPIRTAATSVTLATITATTTTTTSATTMPRSHGTFWAINSEEWVSITNREAGTI